MTTNPATENEYTTENAMDAAGEHLGRDLLTAVLDEVKTMQNVWQKMSEHDQEQSLFRLKNRIRSSVSEAVRIIASKNRPELRAHVKKVVFSDSGVEGQLTISKKQIGRHDLSDAQGEDVLIVISNVDEYSNTMDEVTADPQQSQIF